MSETKHTILGGKVHIYRRENSRFWQCSSFMNGKNRRTSTKEESLKLAKEFAEDWYLTLRGKSAQGELPNDRAFTFATEKFLKEFEADTFGQRNPKCLKNHQNHVRLHLNPFFGRMGLSEITTTKIQEYRLARMKSIYRSKPPALATIQKEIVTLRMTLKSAVRHGWLSHMPDMTAPYRGSTKVSHRA